MSTYLRINRLFCPRLPASGVPFELPEKQANHLCKVLRMQEGDKLHLFDGQGLEYTACIVCSQRKKVIVELGERVSNQRESPLVVSLGQVISRGDRMDFAVQKAVELGVSSITPLFSARSEVKLDPVRLSKRRHHWQQIVYSACEQCGRACAPEVKQPVMLANWLQTSSADVKIILHTSRVAARELQLPPVESKPTSIAVVVGPEGGFSEQEIATAQEQDFIPLTLGPRILRTETAPIVALAYLQQRWGDYGPQ